MQNARHGHDVMSLMIRSGRTYSREDLVKEIHGQFGAETLFYTCSADGMNAEQLIEFLVARGKIRVTPEGLTMSGGQMCEH